MTDDTQEIKCVIFTMRKQNVILSSANFVEIISVKELKLANNRPNWFLGEMKWRGSEVPLISFEAAANEDVSVINLNTQAVVINSVGEHGEKDIPFLALVASGVPHVTHFTREQIATSEDDLDDHPMIAQEVRINGARVNILDIDAIVEMLHSLNGDVNLPPHSEDSKINESSMGV